MKKNIMKNLDKIAESRNISEETRTLIYRRLISNFAFAISFIILILTYKFASGLLPMNMAEIIYSVASIVFIIFTIIVFEIGYKKDDGKFAVTGIELLMFSLLSLFSPYIFYVFNYKYMTAILGIGTLYYIVKIIVIYNKEMNKAFKENNDISVIIKKESQDKLAKKFGKVKNDEIKTVITTEKPKRVNRKKTTTKPVVDKITASVKTNSKIKKEEMKTTEKTEKADKIITVTREKVEKKKEEDKSSKPVVKKSTTNKTSKTTKSTTKPKTATNDQKTSKTKSTKQPAKTTTKKTTAKKDTGATKTVAKKASTKTATAKASNSTRKTNKTKEKTTTKKGE